MTDPVRVVVIDDDDVTRVGTVAILAADRSIEIVRSGSHDDATGPWDGVDVVLVDASDHRRSDDHFPGVGVVQAIRADGAGATCTIIVFTGVLFDDAVRRRMREAGADFYYHRSELADAQRLVDVVLGRGERQLVPEPADPEVLFRLGVTERTQVNDGVAAASELDLVSGDAGLGKRGSRRTRRRETFNGRARLSPVASTGRPVDRAQEAPSLPQIDRFLRWATRIRRY